MRHKLSISIDEKLLNLLDTMLTDGTFRNKSHLVEVALKKFVEGKDENH